MYNLKIAILKYFYDTTKGIEDHDKITELEEHLLSYLVVQICLVKIGNLKKHINITFILISNTN